MNTSEYTFYPTLDSHGHDAGFFGKKSIDELKHICDSSDEYVGFNTLGFVKLRINDNLEPSKYFSAEDGLYVKKRDVTPKFDDYDFFPNVDSFGGDIQYIDPNNIYQVKKQADKIGAAGFNTFGFIKNAISVAEKFVNSTGGLYVRKKKTNFRVKLLCNWCTSEELCKDWNRMSKGNYTWNDIVITANDNADFYVIVNKPLSVNEFYVPERTIVMRMEPWCHDPKCNWGVKTWGEWARPDESKFLQVRYHEKYLNNTFWQLATTYSEFQKMGTIEKTQVISSVCSSKYYDPGHILRIDFLKYVESKNDDAVKIHVYNHDNDHKFKNYMGPHPHNYKDAAILPYKYYFMMENNAEHNFITEKIWESLICECLCFYWGCPNISDWIDPRSYVLLDVNDFEKSYQMIRNAILTDEWSKRLPYIKQEKERVLNYYNFFPTIERTLKDEFKFDYSVTDFDVKYQKYFRAVSDKQIRNACFIHTQASQLTNLFKTLERMTENDVVDTMDVIFVVNIGRNNQSLTCDVALQEKIVTVNYSENAMLTSAVTHDLINLFCQKHTNCKITFLDTSVADHGVVNNLSLCSRFLVAYPKVGMDAHGWMTRGDHVRHFRTAGDVFNPSSSQLDYDMSVRIKCVNLVRRPDRRKEVTAELVREGLITHTDFFDAIDGQKLEATDEIKKLFVGNDFRSVRGVIGCALSHYTLWQQLVADDIHDKYLILEDDIVIADDFTLKMNVIIEKMKNVAWDIIYLGYHDRRRKNYDHLMTIQEYNTSQNIGGTFGYLVTKAGANKFLQFIAEKGIKHGIDYLMFNYHKEMGLKQFQVSPQLILSEFVDNTGVVDSDIQYDNSRLF